LTWAVELWLPVDGNAPLVCLRELGQKGEFERASTNRLRRIGPVRIPRGIVNAQLDGILTARFDVLPPRPGFCDLITLDPGGRFVGDFRAIRVEGLPDEAVYTIAITANDAGQQVYRLEVTAVPEPYTFVLVLTAAVCLGGCCGATSSLRRLGGDAS